MDHLEKALEIARKMNDKNIILSSLGNIDWWALFGGKLDYLQRRIATDVSEMEELGKRFLGFLGIKFSINRVLVNYYATIARWGVFNPSQRIEFAEKGIKYGEDSIKDPAVSIFHNR